MENEAIQDKWPKIGTYCWGCGRNNEHGLQIKSYWEGNECVCTWKPKKYHCALPGAGCGGIIAAILDCHCLNTAISALMKAEGLELDPNVEPTVFYVTGTLSVKFLKPAPLNKPWVFRARVEEMGERKITVSCSVFAKEKEFARGQIAAVRVGT
jgi:acyl-coenzyme A thioesterase PaaI-like protein